MAHCNVKSIDSIKKCFLLWHAAFRNDPKSNMRSTSVLHHEVHHVMVPSLSSCICRKRIVTSHSKLFLVRAPQRVPDGFFDFTFTFTFSLCIVNKKRGCSFIFDPPDVCVSFCRVLVFMVSCHNTPQCCGTQQQTHTMNTNTTLHMTKTTRPNKT